VIKNAHGNPKYIVELLQEKKFEVMKKTLSMDPFLEPHVELDKKYLSFNRSNSNGINHTSIL